MYSAILTFDVNRDAHLLNDLLERCKYSLVFAQIEKTSCDVLSPTDSSDSGCSSSVMGCFDNPLERKGTVDEPRSFAEHHCKLKR